MVCIIIAGLFIVLGLSWSAAEDEENASNMMSDEKPSPDWNFTLWMMGIWLLAQVMMGIIFQIDWAAHHVKGSLEYTSIKIQDLKDSRHYKYKKLTTELADETDEHKMRRQLAQLKVEAELVGWSSEMLAKQEEAVRTGFKSKMEGETLSSELETKESGLVLIQAQLSTVLYMGKHTFVAMPLVLGVLCVVIAVVVPGVGALGLGLTVGVFHMPDERDDPVVIEYSWQLINMIFSFMAIWKGPQRVRLMYHILRRDFEQMIDGQVRSLVNPGVLLTRRQIVIIAGLRISNVCSQWAVSFFMWAWFPRCMQENLDLHIDCESRPPWGVPVFMVVAMVTDGVQGALLHHFITKCMYITWPDPAWKKDPLMKAKYQYVVKRMEEDPLEDATKE